MATILNSFFASVSTDKKCASTQPYHNKTEKLLYNLLILKSDVLHETEKVKNNKSSGSDIISPKLKKKVKHQAKK